MLEFQSAVDDVVAATYVPATMELVALGSTCVLRHKIRPSAKATTPLWRHGADVDVGGSRLLCSSSEYILLQLAGDAALALYNAGADTMVVETIPSSLQQPFLVAAISPTGATVVLLASDRNAAVRWRVPSPGMEAGVEPSSAWSSISLVAPCGMPWAASLHSRLLGSVFAIGYVALRAAALEVHTTYMDDDDDSVVAMRVRSLARPCVSTSVVSVAFHRPSQCLAIVVAPSTAVFASIATDHEATYTTSETIVASAWHPRLPHLVVLTAQGSIYIVQGQAGTYIKATLVIVATSMPPDLHISVVGDTDRAKLLVHSATSIQLYTLQVAAPPPSPPSPSIIGTSDVSPHGESHLVSAFLERPPTDVDAALDAFLASSALCIATRREHVLLKLVAVAVHPLHSRVACFSIRSLVFFLFHMALHAHLDCIDRLTNLLRDAPPADHWAPNYANRLGQLRAPSHPLPYAPAIATYLATLDVDPAHTRALGSYDVATSCRLADVAWLRQQPHDVAFLQALGCVLALHYLGLTPHMLLGRHLVALSLWAELPPVAQWSRTAALQLVAKLEALCHFVIQVGATFTTASTDAFLRDLCAERRSLHTIVCSRYLATVLHVYRTLPVLSDLHVVGSIADVDSLHTASPFLAAYRLDTKRTVAVASAREAAAIAFVVRRLHAVRAHLAASDHGLPCLFAVLGANAPPLHHVAKLLQPSLPLLGLKTSSPSTYAPRAAAIARTIVWTVWAAVARDAAAISLRAKLPGGIWHVIRVTTPVFGLPAADIRSIQLTALHESLSWSSTPLESAHALAYLRASSMAPARLTKREQRLVAEVNLRIGSNYVETKQVFLERQLGSLGGALRLVRGDPLFWHVCQLVGLDSSPGRVIIVEDRADDVQSYSDAISRLEVLELLHAQESALAHQVVAVTKTLVHGSRAPPVATSCQATATDAVPQTTTATQVHSTAVVPRVLLKLRSDTAITTSAATLVKRTSLNSGIPPSSEPAPSRPHNEAPAFTSKSISSKQSSRNVLQLLQLQKAKLREPAVAPRPLERARTMVLPPPVVQPLTFSGHDPSTAHLKLLRKAASMASVPLRPKSFEPAACVPSARIVLPTPISDATPIQDASSQTAIVEDVVVAEPPARLVQDGATNTVLHEVVVDSTQTEETRIEARPPITVKKPPPFPVFVQLQSKTPASTYLRVVDLASTPPAVVEDTLAVVCGAVAAVECPSEVRPSTAPTVASPPADSPTAMETTRSQTSVAAEGTTVNEAPIGLMRFSSMKQQLDDMRKRLADIEQFADAIESDFSASHEMMNRIEARRRAMTPSAFVKQLSALEATHAHLASSLATTKAKLTTSAPPRTSVLATEAAANVADATKLLQQLEESLLPPTTTTTSARSRAEVSLVQSTST